MKVLLLGYSNIAKRRILPALHDLGVLDIDIASHSTTEPMSDREHHGRMFRGYDDAIEHSTARLVYISTLNHLHAPLARRALESGRHVIVDKPAFLSFDDTQRLTTLAHDRGLCLAEANVYPHHPQIEAVKQLFTEVDSQPMRLTATFSFPPLPPENFRYRRDCGGGALWDLGPYAVSPGRIFFNAAPETVCCHVLSRKTHVDVAFSVLLTYPGGRSMVGQYGFTTGYLNRLEVLGDGVAISVDPAFTTPVTLSAQLAVNQNNLRRTVSVSPADSFGVFLTRVLDAVETGDVEPWLQALLDDASALARIRAAAGLSE